MKHIIIFLFSTLTFLSINAQGVNVDLLGQLDYEVLHDTELNDVWGYVDEDGNEYALVGAEKGVSVVDLTDPQNPVEIYWLPGSNSVWRDLKVFGDFAYITTEGSDGLQIIDLTPLPGGSISNTSNYFGPSGDNWFSAHNLYIDENGYGYVFGSNRGEGGVIILDLFTDPMNPIEVGAFDDWYVHDGYVENDIMYLAHISDGFFSIVDISDKSFPVLLGMKETPSNFAHNIWLSDNGNYVFTTDEVSDAYLAAYDVSDPSNIFEVDRIQSSPGEEVVPHNAHVMENFLITSYYADGVVIHDISDPYNMIEIGSYDTYPGISSSTIGNWGAYPYLPSGILLATDIENGLFVLDPNYTFGAKLIGSVINSTTSNPVQGVKVNINGSNQPEYTSLDGNYRTGIRSSGLYDVSYEKYGYESQVISTSLSTGDTVNQDVQLVPIPDFSIDVKVEDVDGNPILNADVRLVHDENIFNETTNGLGLANFSLVFDDMYELTVGKWGYISHCETVSIDESSSSISIVLNEGYYDDFSFDFGWSSTTDAESGDWERVIPSGEELTGSFPNPNIDSPLDCGNYAYVTDSRHGSTGNVSDGTVTLISPVFDASNLEDPHIYYERWFYNFHGYEPFNDTLKVVLSNGTTFSEIDLQGSNFEEFDKWIPVSVRVKDFMNPSSTMQLFISTSDFPETENITDAGFDNFRVSEGSILKNESNNEPKGVFKIFPNPFKNSFHINGDKLVSLNLFDLKGKQVEVAMDIKNDNATIYTETLSEGIYVIQINGVSYKIVKF